MKQYLKLTGVATLTTAALTTALILNQDGDTPRQGKQNSNKSEKRLTSQRPQPSTAAESILPFSKLARDASKIASGGEESVDEILANLYRANSQRERAMLADALALIGSDQAIRGLIGFTNKLPNIDHRSDILESFKALSNPASLPALSASLTEPSDSRTLKAVIDALGRLADPSTINHLVEKYRKDPSVKTQRGQITQALANVKNPDTARTLASIARTAPEPGLVEAAARALSKIGTTTAAQGLVDARDEIGESNPMLHDSISELIRRLENPEGKRLLANLQNDQPQ